MELTQSLQDLAAHEAMPRFERACITIKSDGSLLSDADLAIQHALPGLLGSFYPAPILGEEAPEEEQKQLWEQCQKGAGTFWIADPIDGTTNFATGLPWFALSVALVHKGVTVIGVTVAPALGKSWYASLGNGSYCNGTRLNLGSTTPGTLKDCVVGVDMTYLPHHLRHKIADVSPAGVAREADQQSPWRGWRSLGSSTLEWCALASGQINAYVHGGQMPWDAAAGRLILSEAGGFSCLLTKLLEQNNDPLLLQPTGYAAASPGVWKAWQDWLTNDVR